MFDIFPTGPIVFTPDIVAGTVFTGAIFTCELEPVDDTPIEILSRVDRQFCIDGKNVCLQELTIRKNFTLTIIATLATGEIFTSVDIPVSSNELVTLCAPESTDVEITYTELDCFVATSVLGSIDLAGDRLTFDELVISVTACQSIQSILPVTVELSADFCGPREDFIIACPPPSHPPQCPHLFPDDEHKGHNGHCH